MQPQAKQDDPVLDDRNSWGQGNAYGQGSASDADRLPALDLAIGASYWPLLRRAERQAAGAFERSSQHLRGLTRCDG
jgi:hypothetical protein